MTALRHLTPGTNNFTYDYNGNLTSDGTRNFAYDDENQLVGAWVADVWSNNFVYDGLMRKRIERDYSWQGGSWVETNEVHFIYDGNLVVQERWFNPQLSTQTPFDSVTYTRGNDLSGSLQGAGGSGGLLARTDMGKLIGGDPTANGYYFNDPMGNVAGMLGTNGMVVAQYQYDPYGNLISMTGPLASANRYRFSSKEWNDNAGLYYYGYRFYDPNLQRWLNRDPIQENGGINLYRAMNNSPVNVIDPMGLYVQYTTASGMTYVTGESYSDLTGALQGAINSGDLITELKISGHGDDNLISLDPYGDNILVGTDNGIYTGDGQDITKLLNGALAPNAKVYLNGCHTGRGNDNIAQQMSRLLPGRTVTGQRGFVFGLTGNFGYNINGQRYELDLGGLESLPAGRVIGRKGYYQNGNLIGKGWLWNGF